MVKILVTGGLGYIGSHTVVELHNQGFEPIIVDNLCNSDIRIYNQLTKITERDIKMYNINLCNKEDISILRKEQSDISGIIHFAALKFVGESVKVPLNYYYNNIVSIINLLEVYKDVKINFVFSSSCTVYGQPDTLPVNEESPIKSATSPYGATKQMCETILRDFVSSNGNIKTTILRYFNPIGAHESGLIGELPCATPQNLIPFITQTAIGKRSLLRVFGDNYNTRDGTCIRDYIHVVDLAKAHISALNYMGESTVNHEVFNIGTGNGFTVLEIIKSFEEATGVSLNYEIGERREGDVEQIWGNVDKSLKILKWSAERSLSDMVKSAWKWEVYMRDNNF